VPESLPFLSEELTASGSPDDGTRELTRRLARGDETSWRDFHAGYRRRVRGLLLALWQGPEEALDDLVQETFLRAVRHMRVFGDEHELWCWLGVLARSAAFDAGRKRGRRQRFLERWRREPRAVPPVTEVGLAAAMGRIPEPEAELLRMKYESGRSVRSIAAELGLSEKAVEGRLGRARRRLRKELERDR